MPATSVHGVNQTLVRGKLHAFPHYRCKTAYCCDIPTWTSQYTHALWKSLDVERYWGHYTAQMTKPCIQTSCTMWQRQFSHSHQVPNTLSDSHSPNQWCYSMWLTTVYQEGRISLVGNRFLLGLAIQVPVLHHHHTYLASLFLSKDYWHAIW